MFLLSETFGMQDQATSRPGRTAKRRSNLADLEEKLELFIENVKDYAIFMLGPKGRATTWNAGVQRVLGYPEEEFIGLEFRRCFALRKGTPQSRKCRGLPKRVAQTTSAGM
jgi:PAS domain-containing protein